MLDFVVRIYELNFDSIVVDGKKYDRDVRISVDGRAKKRKGGLLLFGSHEVRKLGLEELSRGQPELTIADT